VELTPEQRENLAAVFQSLPAERLAPYMTASGENLFAALKLYRKNVVLSGAMYESLYHLEVSYRSLIDAALVSRHQYKSRGGDWLDDRHGEFASAASAKLLEARKAAGNATSVAGHRGSAVAELSFGFWRRLIDAKYENVHGSAVMRRVPSLKGRNASDMGNLRQLVEPLYSLRNRIAHLEPIWDRNLPARRDDAHRVIGLTSKEAAAWAKSLCRLDETMKPR